LNGVEQGEAYYTAERISQILSRSDSETQGLILFLLRQLARVKELEARVQELEARLAQNSRNSSKLLSSAWGAPST
jgi:hypothetical protein